MTYEDIEKLSPTERKELQVTSLALVDLGVDKDHWNDINHKVNNVMHIKQEF